MKFLWAALCGSAWPPAWAALRSPLIQFQGEDETLALGTIFPTAMPPSTMPCARSRLRPCTGGPGVWQGLCHRPVCPSYSRTSLVVCWLSFLPPKRMRKSVRVSWREKKPQRLEARRTSGAVQRKHLPLAVSRMVWQGAKTGGGRLRRAEVVEEGRVDDCSLTCFEQFLHVSLPGLEVMLDPNHEAPNTFPSSPHSPSSPGSLSVPYTSSFRSADAATWEICQGYFLAFFRRVSTAEDFRESSHAQQLLGLSWLWRKEEQASSSLGHCSMDASIRGRTLSTVMRLTRYTYRTIRSRVEASMPSAGPWPLGSPEVAAEHGPEAGDC